MEQDISYDCRWSNALDSKFISDFIFVFESVFNSRLSESEFSRKYIKNIYGPSLLVVAYIDGKPCGTRVFWRNDIDSNVAYQPVDTGVLEVYRGKGIFTKMTMKALSIMPTDAIVYNFPNHRSYPGDIKMGWKLYADYHLKLFTSYKEFKKTHPVMMDDEYVNWYAKDKDLEAMKIFNHYFLVAEASRKFCYRIVGEISEKSSRIFPKRYMGIVFFLSPEVTWYNKRFAPNHLVTRNSEVPHIPTWKTDALC